jgi:hypothetical protein
MPVAPRWYRLARWGALFGGGLALFETVTYLLTLRLGTPADYAVLSFLNLLFEGAVPVAAGALAAREEGEVTAGLFTGLVSGAIVAVVSILYQFVVPAPPGFFPGAPPDPADEFVGYMLATGTTLALGAWGGWLGGRWGAARSKNRQD